jgi:hypothetical protein
MTHLTYLEATVVGLIQGVSELFPVSVYCLLAGLACVVYLGVIK